MKKVIFYILLIFTSTKLFAQHSGEDAKTNIKHDSIAEVFGMGFLSEILGLWSGSVTTVTPAGNFPLWFVDFRPVSTGQVSQYTLIDSESINNLSFFIVKHDNQLKVAMRTEGCFNDQCCVTYEVMDSVNNEERYYQFSDFQRGTDRAYTEFTFTDGKLLMEVFTNKFNQAEPGQFHARWEATLGDRNATSDAIEHFNYPQAIMIKDFSFVFDNLKESIFYDLKKDPYNLSSQPYVGSVTIDISISDEIITNDDCELFLLFTTESLFDGLKYKKDGLKYYSRSVYLPMGTKSFTLDNVHPGKYYVYSFIDANQDKKHKSGDYMSSDPNNIVIVPSSGNVKVMTNIDLRIP